MADAKLELIIDIGKQNLRYNIAMPKTVKKGVSNFLEKAQLVKLKIKALRAGVWFRGLSRIDRVLVDLTVKVADNIRSPNLAKCILAVVGKLENLLENKLERAIREIGLPLAQKLSGFAQKWGNMNAKAWANDVSFARFWAVMKLNGHSCSSGVAVENQVTLPCSKL